MKTAAGKYVYRDGPGEKRMHLFYDRALDSLGVEYTETYADTSFGRTHILFAGDTRKPPVVTLHGGNGISPLNIRLFLRLLDRYSLIAPDVIGMPGKSAPYRNLDPGGDDYGNWLCGLMDSLKLEKAPFAVSSYSSAMLLSLAKYAPERIEKAALLVPSGIAHGAVMPMMGKMALPFMKYYIKPSEKTMDGIMEVMATESDGLWREFFELMMSSYKMEMRPPREYGAKELARFDAPVIIFASDEDIFFPAGKVLPRAERIFRTKPRTHVITGKHLPSDETMRYVCEKIVEFFEE